MLTKAPRPFRTVWAYEIGGSVFKTLSEKKKKKTLSLGFPANTTVSQM